MATRVKQPCYVWGRAPTGAFVCNSGVMCCGGAGSPSCVHTLHGLSGPQGLKVCAPAHYVPVGWRAGATSPVGLARRPTCTDASPEDGSVESSAHCLAGCGFPADPAQNDSQWLPQAPAVRCGLSPPTAAAWVWTVLGAPAGSSYGQDRQLEEWLPSIWGGGGGWHTPELLS